MRCSNQTQWNSHKFGELWIRWMDDATTLTTFLKHSQKFCKKLSKTNN
jgi:hypothetical protein